MKISRREGHSRGKSLTMPGPILSRANAAPAQAVAAPLTTRQRQIFDYILSFRAKHGSSPTIREICERVGIGSPNGVLGHLLALRRRGLIRWTAHTSRSIMPCGTQTFDVPDSIADRVRAYIEELTADA